MSRVLLFVQTGDERPKVWRGKVRNFNTHGMAALTHRACAFKRTADRWWLVECENEQAGRRVIECEHPTKQCDYHCGDHARILASGGRSAPEPQP